MCCLSFSLVLWLLLLLLVSLFLLAALNLFWSFNSELIHNLIICRYTSFSWYRVQMGSGVSECTASKWRIWMEWIKCNTCILFQCLDVMYLGKGMIQTFFLDGGFTLISVRDELRHPDQIQNQNPRGAMDA